MGGFFFTYVNLYAIRGMGRSGHERDLSCRSSDLDLAVSLCLGMPRHVWFTAQTCET